jgi:hypothetical protein
MSGGLIVGEKFQGAKIIQLPDDEAQEGKERRYQVVVFCFVCSTLYQKLFFIFIKYQL